MENHTNIDENFPILPSSLQKPCSDSEIDEEEQIYQVREGFPDWWYYPEHIKNSLARTPTRTELIVQAKWQKRCKQMKERYAAEDADKNSPGGHRPRKVSLTDEDFDELRGFMGLGYRFDEENCSEKTRKMFPVLDFYFAVKKQNTPAAPPITTWLVNSEDTEERAKTRLRHWAKAVALMELENKNSRRKKRKQKAQNCNN